MTIWPLVPNWSTSLKETYAFKTEILASRNNTEQRIAQRSTPRRTISFDAVADQQRQRDLEGVMALSKGALISMPEFVKGVRTTTAIPNAATSVTVRSVPAWLVSGATVALSARRTVAAAIVDTVVGTTVTFEDPVTASWPSGALLSPLADGWLTDSLSTSRETSAVGTVNVEFNVEPATETPVISFDASASYAGREILLARPNWVDRPTVVFGNFAEDVDYGRGRVERFLPVNFASRTHQATYLERSAIEARYMIDFFQRMKGQRGEFLHPTWQNDLPPMSALAEDDATLTVAGSQVYDRYRGDKVYGALGVVTTGNVLLVRSIEDIVLSGGNSVIQITSDWGIDVPLDIIRMVCWLPVSRFASDNLTVEWITDQVAQVSLSVVTLENTVAEPNPNLVLDGAAQYLISTFGWDFTETVFINPLYWAMNVYLPEIFE